MASAALSLSGLLSLGCDDGGTRDDGKADGGGGELGLETGVEGSATTTSTGTGTTAGNTFEDGAGPGGDVSAEESETGVTPCMEEPLVGKLKPPNVLLVLDKSGSMMTEWDAGGGKQKRWDSLWDTVDFMLENYMQRMTFAVKLFPGEDATSVEPDDCIVDPGIDVPFSFGSTNKYEILANIPRKGVEFEGGTPAVTAFELSLAYMRQVKMEDENMLPQAIILVMDGRVSCDQKMERMQELAAEAKAEDIPVYVVGVDIANDPDDPDLPEAMDALAAAGGTARHYASNNKEELRSAMELIVGKITECNFQLSKVPVNPNLGEMKINGQMVPYLKGIYSCEAALAAGHAAGWIFTSEANNEIDICGGSCEVFADVGDADLLFRCPPP